MSEPKGAGSKLLTQNTDPVPTIQRIEQFVLDAALYAPLPLEPNLAQADRMLYDQSLKTDGFCPYCHDRTTFSRPFNDTYTRGPKAIQAIVGFYSVALTCARNSDHRITTWIRLEGPKNRLFKVGQFPSLADVANDQAKQFSKVLSTQDSRELHRAIGLAANGIGIGSFVYLRRVFERLIKSRFDEHKVAEKWADEDWLKKRMDERIQLMKMHLPEFLVANAKVYGILSKGVHELDEETCLAAFEIVKESIVEMLQEDERKRQKDERQKSLTKALERVSSKLGGG